MIARDLKEYFADAIETENGFKGAIVDSKSDAIEWSNEYETKNEADRWGSSRLIEIFTNGGI